MMASNLYLRDLCNQLHRLEINESSIDNIKHMIEEKWCIPVHEQQLWLNGKRMNKNEELHIDYNILYNEISISLSLNGGKGGFGSMLRAAGKLNKTTNKSAMRDLSGRRYRFVEQEKELTEWIKHQKTNKRMTEEEIQNDFRHIKKYGKLPEKRMCHKGINCRYKWKCKFVHPQNDQDQLENNNNNKNKKKQCIINDGNIFGFNNQTDEEMQNALLMGQINAKQINIKYKQKQKKKKKMIQLFGNEEDETDQDEQDEDEDDDITMDRNKNNDYMNKEIDDEHHEHKLKWIIREDCDFIICDFCSKQYKGPSWHCCKGCDFDLCDDCVIIDNLMDIPKDNYLTQYHKKSNLMKEIEQKDQTSMKIKAFSRGVDRKRKRKEKKLNLLGLENVGFNHNQLQQNKDNNNNNNSLLNNNNNDNNKQRLRGEVNVRGTKDPNEILIDIDLLFPEIINKNNKMDKMDKKIIAMNNKKGEIDLNEIDDVEELKKYGMDKLKIELTFYGLKCGGTLEERAKRLFFLKNNKLSDLPKNCFVSKKKKLKKPPRKKQRISSE